MIYELAVVGTRSVPEAITDEIANLTTHAERVAARLAELERHMAELEAYGSDFVSIDRVRYYTRLAMREG